MRPEVHWIEDWPAAPVGPTQALVWRGRLDGPAAAAMLARAPAQAEDLADAACLGSKRGAGRLLRRRLLRALAARRLGLEPAEVRIGRGEDGRPVLPGPVPAFVSIGGRDGWAVIGLSPVPIGVDVEVSAPVGPYPLSLLHPEERRRLEGLPEPRRAEAFADLWVVKEALAKAVGAGLDEVLAGAPTWPDGSDMRVSWNGWEACAALRRGQGMTAAAILAPPTAPAARPSAPPPRTGTAPWDRAPRPRGPGQGSPWHGADGG